MHINVLAEPQYVCRVRGISLSKGGKFIEGHQSNQGAGGQT